jgi:hypothetical protein|tara:strand:- start:854 stop:1144 length:291 start_codon:yes stop_codon:yes gene_type:complete
MLNFNLFLIKKILTVLVFFPIGFPFSSTEPSDCRLRLRYTSFDKMTKNERITWLFCAYEKLKEGDDKHLRVYKEKNGDIPNYNQFLKLWENRDLDK